ncbi:protein pelota [Nematocida ausubeli]|nr:protein pelota [Nematocida ausubeli]KAI5147628.1 protein pelota [Nematocida ausubeli]KAI5160778.1 protein pelota [Nematocida ausubeli]
MKIFKKSQTKCNVFLDILPEDIDDIYELYRIIDEKDIVKSMTQRSIPGEGGKAKIRVTLLLEVEVEKVTVDLAVGILFVKGKILNETEYTKTGTFHTLEIPVNQRMSLKKDYLSAAAIKMLEGLTLENKASMAYLICRKEGYSLLLATEYTMRRVPLPEKVKSKDKLFKNVLSHLKGNLTAFAIVGPEKEVDDYFKQQPQLKNLVVFIKKSVSSGNTHKGDMEEIDEIFKSPELLKKLKGAKKGNELLAQNNYYRLEDVGTKGIAMGVKEVTCACENYMVKTIIISDGLIKSESPAEREAAEEILKLSKQTNAEINIVSQYTNEGEKIKDRGGVVAILTQPICMSMLLE